MLKRDKFGFGLFFWNIFLGYGVFIGLGGMWGGRKLGVSRWGFSFNFVLGVIMSFLFF